MKFDGGIFHAGEVFSISLLAPQPSVWQNKWRLPFDSACSKGVETTFQSVLTVGGDGV